MKIKTAAGNLTCASCSKDDFTKLALSLPDLDILVCSGCDKITKYNGETNCSRVLGKITPATSSYEVVLVENRSTRKDSVTNSKFPYTKFIIRDEADPNDYLIRIDAKTGIESGNLFGTKEVAEEALRCFKKREQFKNFLMIPVDLWHIANIFVNKSPSTRDLSESTKVLRALEHCKKEMGWKGSSSDMSVFPTIEEIEREVKLLFMYLPGAEEIDAAVLGSFLTADVGRLTPNKKSIVSKLAKDLLTSSQKLGSMSVLCKSVGLPLVASQLDEILKYAQSARLDLRDSVIFPRNGEACSKQVIATVNALSKSIPTLERSVLDVISSSTGIVIPSEVSEKKTSLAMLVRALDLGEQFSSPNGKVDKLMQAALELGMDEKYASEEELLHDLTYLAKSLGIKMDGEKSASVSEDMKVKLDHVRIRVATLFTGFEYNDKKIANLLAPDIGVIKLDIQNSVVDSSEISEEDSVSELVKNIGDGMTKATASNLAIQFGLKDLLSYDIDTMLRLCRALRILTQKFQVQENSVWASILENPAEYIDMKHREEGTVEPGTAIYTVDAPKLFMDSIEEVSQ